MGQIHRLTLWLMVLFLNGHLLCQQSVKGKVINSKSKEPLAFVNIIFNGDNRLGTATDIDGTFQFRHSGKIVTLSCSYLGYQKLTVNIDSIRKKEDELTIELLPAELDLEEVIIKAGENPANRIIRNVIRNRETNNPENIPSFKYTSYTKAVYDFLPGDTVQTDSLKIQIDKLFKGGHIFMMESVTERKYIAPDISEEIITGVKVSGFKHPTFAPIATDIQPFSFYREIITIFDVHYLNPLSDGSLQKYRFNLEDTLYQDNDTVFIISFKPLPGKNFEGLTGVLYVHTKQFAIQNVIASPFKKGLIDIKIQQQYILIDNQQWFPEQLSFEMIITQYPSKLGVRANGKSYIKDVKLLPELRKKEFSLEAVKMHDLAAERDSVFWNKHRPEPLNKKEVTTFMVVDSLGEANKFQTWLDIMEKLSQNRIPVKFIDLDVSKTLVYNKFEGFRLGLGAYTNDKVLRFLSVGGFFGYGLKDHQWKYGSEFILFLNKDKEIEINGKHLNTLREVGASDLNFFRQNYNYRSYMAYRMDRIRQNSLSLGFRAVRYVKLNFMVRHSMVSPQYSYEYIGDDLQRINKYTNSGLTFNLRYAYKEKIIKSLNQRVSIGTKYPVFYLAYTKAIQGIYGSGFNYNKIEVRLDQTFYTKSLGGSALRIEGGHIDQPVPYGLLYTGEGSFDKDFPVLIKNYFQTVRPYEFLSDQYVNFFFAHNFEGLLFQTKKFKPHISLHQNMGWGTLSRPENHEGIEFQTKEKGFFESGLQVDNIVKLNYFNVAYLNLGAGVYCRYGPYSYPKLTDNLALKFSVTFTTK